MNYVIIDEATGEPKGHGTNTPTALFRMRAKLAAKGCTIALNLKCDPLTEKFEKVNGDWCVVPLPQSRRAAKLSVREEAAAKQAAWAAKKAALEAKMADAAELVTMDEVIEALSRKGVQLTKADFRPGKKTVALPPA